MNPNVTSGELPNAGSVRTECQLSSPTADRTQEIPAVQAQPDHHQHRQQKEAGDPEQAGRQQSM